MDAIVLLKNDHREVEKVFKAFEKLDDDAAASKRQTAQEIIRLLTVHTTIEEEVFYPAVREDLPDLKDDILEGIEEHHVAKLLLGEIADLEPDDERYDAKVTVLIESVRHHVEEEEDEMFPQIRKEWGRKRLGELGDALELAKRKV